MNEGISVTANGLENEYLDGKVVSVLSKIENVKLTDEGITIDIDSEDVVKYSSNCNAFVF